MLQFMETYDETDVNGAYTSGIMGSKMVDLEIERTSIRNHVT